MQPENLHQLYALDKWPDRLSGMCCVKKDKDGYLDHGVIRKGDFTVYLVPSERIHTLVKKDSGPGVVFQELTVLSLTDEEFQKLALPYPKWEYVSIREMTDDGWEID